jgi:serine O-acetyltransferase
VDTSITTDDLCAYVSRQINNLFPDGNPVSCADLKLGASDALDRMEFCFQKISVERYFADKEARFDHLYSDQYLMFLWFLSSSLWHRDVEGNILNKVYLLNKSLHAFDCSYDTPLPDVFIVIHGVGTVLGKGTYSDYLAVYQGCTVGQAHGKYPILGRGTGLGAGASVLGSCVLGGNVSIGAGCTLINANVGEGSSVYRDATGKLIVKKTASDPISSEYFSHEYLFSVERYNSQ